MALRFTKTLKFRLIVTTILCAAAVSLFSNLYIYRYLNGIIQQRSQSINENNLNARALLLNDYLADVTELGILCANDTAVVNALEQRDFSPASMRLALSAQTQLNAYLAASPVGGYVDVAIVVNSNGLAVAASTRIAGDTGDYQQILSHPVYQDLVSRKDWPVYLMRVAPSIKKRHEQTLVMICPVLGLGSTRGRSYLYMEVGMDLMSDALAPYVSSSGAFVTDGAGTPMTVLPYGWPEIEAVESPQDGLLRVGDTAYETSVRTLDQAGLRLYQCIRRTSTESDGILYTVWIVVLTSLLLAVVLAVVMSAYLSRPVSRLNESLKRIARNDFSYDPEIEKTSGELGQIGRAVNEMTLSIRHLLDETEKMYDQRRNIEIELLQSQVNPHFLYNTLDSIRWMAVIQKNPGIENMTRSLSNLLKNIAKGTQNKIPLSEELGLLKDYVAIQSVRYMEAFTFADRIPPEFYECRIVKLTLQPLVENAIFHGIEPTGECGTVTVTCREEDGDLLLCVEDDGVGIPPERLEHILTAEHHRSGASLNGIGIANVHKRLQLLYGPRYGLTVESEQGVYTRVTVRIPKEEEKDVSDLARG